MLGSTILDVAIGMAFIYLLLSLIASTIQEALSAIAQSRAANLEHGIRSLFSGGTLDGKCFVKLLYQHGLVRGLYQDSKYDDRHAPPALRPPATAPVAPGTPSDLPEPKHWFREAVRTLLGVRPSHFTEADIADPFLLPAYIPARTFSTSLMAILNPDQKSGVDFLNDVKLRLETEMTAKMPATATIPALENKAAEALHALVMDALNDEKAIEKFRENLENWYNDGMDRVSGWYKKHTQIVLLFIGIGISVAFNVDSIHVARTLWFDRDARQGLVGAAANFLPKATNTDQDKAAQDKSTQDKAAQDKAAAAQKALDADKAILAAKTQKPAADSPIPAAGDSSGSTAAPAPADKNDAQDPVNRMAANMAISVKAFDKVSSLYLLPVGWKYSLADYKSLLIDVDHWDPLHILAQVAGWFVTALALSLGAPFWFDLLNKFMVVRSTVKPQEKSKDEASKS